MCLYGKIGFQKQWSESALYKVSIYLSNCHFSDAVIAVDVPVSSGEYLYTYIDP